MVNKRVSAIEKEQPLNKDSLFTATTDNSYIETINIVNNKTSKQDYRRQTYFLTESLIKALKLKSAHDDMDKSEIVREALKQYIDNKYFDM